jgi:hypothetical protein
MACSVIAGRNSGVLNWGGANEADLRVVVVVILWQYDLRDRGTCLPLCVCLCYWGLAFF